MAQTHTPRDLRGELQRDDGSYPESWKPSPGDMVVGTVTGYSSAMGNYGKVVICTIEEETLGRLAIWISSTVLKGEFSEHKPKVGERLGIKYLGPHATKNYHRYRLVVDRPDSLPDFEASATDDEPTGDWNRAKDLPPEAESGSDGDPPF